RIATVPGKPADSELFKRITTSDADERMPDPKSNKKLSDRDIAVIKKWIEQGAKWKGHWAYLKPTRPEAPPVADPALAAFVKNPIDQFVLAKLKMAGLKPPPEADRATLIRGDHPDPVARPPNMAG